MNCKHRITIFAAIMTTSFTASAQEVFEKVDPQGGVEFSDQPSPGAKAIDVKPNVVNVTPVKPIQPTAPASSAGGKGTPASSAQPEEIRDVGTSNIYDDDEKRENLKERHEELKDREKPVQLPANKGAGKKAVRGSTQAR